MIRKLFLNAALGAGSILLTWILLEIFFGMNLHRLPLRYQGYLPIAIRVIAQSSKNGLIPKNYVALLGDSYAQGKGDWFLEVSHWKNPPYASQHLLSRQLSVDVVTFGQSGHGNMAGLLGTPFGILRLLEQTWFYRLQEPRRALVYFYEGNDLNNNFEEIAMRFLPHYPMGKLFDKKTMEDFVKNRVMADNAKAQVPWHRNFLLLNFIGRILAGPPPFRESENPPEPGTANRVLIQGKVVAIPDGLQSPALELNENELKITIYLFSKALESLKTYFPRTEIIVVYIPSPLSCYQLASERVSVQTYHRRSPVYSAAQVAVRSNFIAARIRDVCQKEGVPFWDARPHLREVAVREFIHGPSDWRHFNRRGYEALVQTIVKSWTLLDKPDQRAS